MKTQYYNQVYMYFSLSFLKLIEIVILWVYYTIPFGFNLFWHFLVITFQPFYTSCLANDHWRGLSTRNAHMVHIVNLFRLKNGVNILVEVSIWINMQSLCKRFLTHFIICQSGAKRCRAPSLEARVRWFDSPLVHILSFWIFCSFSVLHNSVKSIQRKLSMKFMYRNRCI